MTAPIQNSLAHNRFRNVSQYLEDAQRALDAGHIIAATYWFTLADLCGARSMTMELCTCVEEWMERGRPEEDDDMDDDTPIELTEYERSFGFSALLWFSQQDPTTAIEWFRSQSLSGNFYARCFGFKFLGNRFFIPRRETTDDWGDPRYVAWRLMTICIVILTLVAIAFMTIYCTK